ncbi:alpha-L-rhamnosidase [Microbacterium terrae]|uniref:alpha-L-rhamnosidase n=1 Tax=Microbacterium terrae TaxID=69369 RepID=A0A0M2H0M0_9MICO|nr:alpha-L-rhamnosidase [Microbacterium terrae]KJL37560.1 Bacterial alpha-L-rhamnosidase [Microbacterium terrae]MBP1076390.1 alpha-L-rhamnosidase [Microbacterium terrae]GLJ97215.1 alpha-L-rhamnosidase [Microbacterium terrae]
MTQTATPSAPRFEHFPRAPRVLGVGTPAPRLTWSITGASSGFAQAAYEIEVTIGNRVSSAVVEGDEQVLVPWPVLPLTSRATAAVRVRVRDAADWGPWSDSSTVEVGLLDAADWEAQFVSPVGIAGLDEPAPIVSRTFEIPGEVRSARLYATAHGIYQASVNGTPVDDTVLAPGWTSYDDRLRYHTYDVTQLVREGANDFSALLGNGWYRGYLSYMGERALYGERVALCAQLEVVTEDGAIHVIATDTTWTAHESQIISDDLYNGQTADLRRDPTQAPRVPVEIVPAGTDALVAPDGPPVRPTGYIAAQKVWISPAGRTLIDFGQNAVGWVRVRTRGLPAGTEVVVRHAEVLENDELGTRPLRSAKATDVYTLAGTGEEVLEPVLTLHGFRYADVTGIPDLTSEDVTMVLIGTDLERTGWFDSSHELLNQLHENVVWSTRGNFVDIPTDCPQRNERLGWTGDLQVFGPTAQYLYDVSGLVTSWLADLAAEQYPTGAVPHVIPNTVRDRVDDPATAAWGDAATLVPWNLFLRTGDAGILRRQLHSMRAWVDHVEELAGEDLLWNSGFQFGDWLDPSASPHDPADAKAAAEVVATAHFARSAEVVSEAAEVIGEREVAARYAELAERVRAAFVAAYVTPSGRLMSEAQTTYALALEWGLLPTEAQRSVAGGRLADLVRKSGFRIATGFVGTPLVCDALIGAGHADVAYRLLFQTACPSWLYPVTMGATTIWERWDSMLPDGSINPGEMTSFNHYALGAVADTLHRSIAGLEPAAPGYRRVRIAPLPPKQLSRASARHVSPYGDISVGWERVDGAIVVTASLPVGVGGDVVLPGSGETFAIGHGTHTWTVAISEQPAHRDFTGATIRDLLDEGEAWQRTVEALMRVGLVPEGELQALRLVATAMDAPAAEVSYIIAEHIEGGRGYIDRSHEVHAKVAAILGAAAPVPA